jgi:hypothetical protein
MSCHHEVGARHVLPEKGSGEMNRIERAEFRRHRLRRAIEDCGIDLDQFEGGDQLQNSGTPARHFRIVEAGA